MNIVAYILTLSNLHSLGGPGVRVKDMSMKVADVSSLANDVKHFTEFPLDSFKRDGFSRVGDVGIYLSKNLRKHLYGNSNDDEEGFIIKLFYEECGSLCDSDEHETVTYFIRREGLDEADVGEVLSKYVTESHRRHKRSTMYN